MTTNLPVPVSPAISSSSIRNLIQFVDIAPQFSHKVPADARRYQANYYLALAEGRVGEAHPTESPSGISGFSSGSIFTNPLISEDALLAKLPAQRRWAYVAKKHPLQFWLSIATVFCAVYVLVRGVSMFFPKLAELIIPSAAAQGTFDFSNAVKSMGLQGCVAVVMAVALLWSYGIASWASATAKISLAKDSIRFLQGFFAGMITGFPK